MSTIVNSPSLWSKLAENAESQYSYGTLRAVSPTTTVRNVAPLLARAGITRLADLTGLDFLGIPVYQAVRPNSRNLTVAQGKGVTRAHAKASALMESLEFFHAEDVAAPRMSATYGAMRWQLGYDPARLQRPSWGELRDDLELEWVAATELTDGAPTWVPLQLCELNATVSPRLAKINFLTASNGLASGNTFAEAVAHGLYELIERDAVAADEQLRFSAERGLRLETVTSALARSVLTTLNSAGRLFVHVPRSPFDRPCFEAFFESDDIPHVTFFGAGAHPRPQVALIKALVEVAQSRLTYIAGSRDDLDRRIYRSPNEIGQQPPVTAVGPAWPEDPAIDFRTIRAATTASPSEDLRELADAIRDRTGAAPMAVDLSRPEFGLPVVFVVAPGLGVNHYTH